MSSSKKLDRISTLLRQNSLDGWHELIKDAEIFPECFDEVSNLRQDRT
jgi:hypothetical protein